MQWSLTTLPSELSLVERLAIFALSAKQMACEFETCFVLVLVSKFLHVSL